MSRKFCGNFIFPLSFRILKIKIMYHIPSSPAFLRMPYPALCPLPGPLTWWFPSFVLIPWLIRNNGSELKTVRGVGGGVFSELRMGHQYDCILSDLPPALPLRLSGDCIVRMIGEEIMVRDELASGDNAWVGYISRRSQFEFAGGMMTLRVDCGSGALAAESPRMTQAYEDSKGRMHPAAVSSNSGSSIKA